MLYGRRRELGQLREAAGAARDWAGRALLVRGEPGIGKSALLDEARAQAASDGLRVLATRGVSSEATRPFAALSALLLPLLARLDELPPAQAAILGGALGFTALAPSDPFAVAAAALNLLGVVSTDEPMLLVVDDAHWLDPASSTALLFISGRLADQAMSLVVAVRPDTDAFARSRFETLEITGLAYEPARALMTERFSDTIAPEVSDRLIEATGGNPLALLEVPVLLSAGQLAGLDPLVGPLPAGEATSEAYRQQIARLPAETRRALAVTAAGDDDVVVIARALHILGLDRKALTPAEEAGLIQLEQGRMRFRHALVRSVAYSDASLAERRDAHKALAHSQVGDDTRRAWHLAAAADGPDEEVAAALEAVAVAASTRSGFSEASRAFSQAAELSTDRTAQARRLLSAGQAAIYAGELPRAQALTEAAWATAPGPAAGARAQQLRGRLDIWWPGRPLMETALRLVEESHAAEEVDVEIALAILFDAVFALIGAGDLSAADAPARHALELADRTESGALKTEIGVMNLWIACLAGSQDDPLRMMIRHRERVDRTRPEAAQLALFLDVPLLLLGEHEAFLSRLASDIAAARSAAALIPLAALLAVRADGEMHMGLLQLAETDAVEAASLSPPGSLISTYANVMLARVEALTGSADSCRARVDQVLRETSVSGSGAVSTLARAALATLDQTLGLHERAFERHVANAAVEQRQGLRNPLITGTPVGLIEMSVQVGRPEAGPPQQAALEQAAKIFDVPTLHAFAAYGRGLLAPGNGYSDHFEEALAWHERGGRRFDQARTQLAYGQRLRRDRHRVEARAVLHRAIETFDEAGSTPWAERALRELRATGETTLPRVPSSRALLTPQELQVARLAAEGMSNRDIATRLFISPKTVEKHLTSTFRKLDVSSRRELILAAARLLGV